ncbi:histidine kinase [Dactylosporangium sp. AC04546]|uniref:sensor histidine kinase n=1 Tax=Dactylosporangium sp. AC04546 TaxID=2862460 RepID=UPI002E7C0D71|nr:histidine kinase [Dactylosporangium sp. AC04546]WVK83021.1 histidine kinase [Dactylosporangium sp. AC04546]
MTLRRIAEAVVFAVVQGFTTVALAASWGGAYWVPDALAGGAVCAAALLRHRWPLAAPLAGLAVAGVSIALAVPRVVILPAQPGPGAAAGLAVLLAAVVRRLPPRPAAAVAAGGLAVAAASWLTGNSAGAGLPVVTGLNLLAWLAGVGAGLLLRERARRRRDAAAAVRLDLARELHDEVAHHVTGIVLQAQAARILARRRPGELDGALAGIETAGTEALAAMRRVVALLREGADLSDLVSRYGGPPVRLRLPPGGLRCAPAVSAVVYRVVQESLTNVTRHAPAARSVTVTVAESPSSVTVRVADDGPAAGAPAGGYGLVGMRERVEALGGTLCAGPAPSGGWAVQAVLPREAR